VAAHLDSSDANRQQKFINNILV